ncbi:hypothetical protein L0152_15270 [bacterium]|nr:hypothetical protein [bacterium]
MKKFIILAILGLVICLQPSNLLAKTFCFAGGGGAAGSYFYLSGGKVELKPFSGNWVIPGGTCNVPAWGSIVLDSVGNVFISVNTVHDPTTPCTSVWFTASGTSTSSLSGQYDNNQDGSFEGAFTMTEVNCGTIPPAKPSGDRSPGSAGAPKAEQ